MYIQYRSLYFEQYRYDLHVTLFYCMYMYIYMYSKLYVQ